MSYCRWSSDNWKCDLYCYEYCEGGWTTHVAGTRIVGDVPEVRWDGPNWMDTHKAVGEFLKSAEYRNIGLPYDGKTFNDPTLETFRDRLLYLRGVGYNFPDYVLENIKEEIAERDVEEVAE